MKKYYQFATDSFLTYPVLEVWTDIYQSELHWGISQVYKSYQITEIKKIGATSSDVIKTNYTSYPSSNVRGYLSKGTFQASEGIVAPMQVAS